MSHICYLAPYLGVYSGTPSSSGDGAAFAIKVGVLDDGEGRLLLIDAGLAPDAVAALPGTVHLAILTHHHSDTAFGLHTIGSAGAAIAVPAAEEQWISNVESFWNDANSRWHIYNVHPHHQMLAEPIMVSRALSHGDVVEWGESKVYAVATPGHTEGSMSYIVVTPSGDVGSVPGAEADGAEADGAFSRGELAVAFVGGLIYGDGQVFDVHSLQYRPSHLTDYHGFLGAKNEILASLRKVFAVTQSVLSDGAVRQSERQTTPQQQTASQQQPTPHYLVPSRGPVIAETAAAYEKLESRLAACYDEYASVSALRWYFPALFDEERCAPSHPPAPRSPVMPTAPTVPPPDWLRHIGTSWVVISADRAAFVMDCGSADVVAELRQMLSSGEIRRMEGIWVTHYHDDHVHAIEQLVRELELRSDGCSCPVIAVESVAGIISEPMAWRLPCISPTQVKVDFRPRDGESWQWHEFTLTAYEFPGQTLYHGGLSVEGRGHRLIFAGDSFTPTGMDDYCAGNRNLLGPGLGYDKCLSLLERLDADMLFNSHVDVGFRFAPVHYSAMRESLNRRVSLFADLTPWPHPNFATDEAWAHCYPYEQPCTPGQPFEIAVIVTNHLHREQDAGAVRVSVRLHLPPSWKCSPSAWVTADVMPSCIQKLHLSGLTPETAKPGRHVATADIIFDGIYLPHYTESILVVGGVGPA